MQERIGCLILAVVWSITSTFLKPKNGSAYPRRSPVAASAIFGSMMHHIAGRPNPQVVANVHSDVLPVCCCGNLHAIVCGANTTDRRSGGVPR